MFEKKTKFSVAIGLLALTTAVVPLVMKKLKRPIAAASDDISDKIVHDLNCGQS